MVGSVLLCKAKRQYLLTCKVSRYCLLALHGSVAVTTPGGERVRPDPLTRGGRGQAWAVPALATWLPGDPPLADMTPTSLVVARRGRVRRHLPTVISTRTRKSACPTCVRYRMTDARSTNNIIVS